MATGIQVVIDCADPARLAEFWAAALGYVVQPPPPGIPTVRQFQAVQGRIALDWLQGRTRW